MEGRKIVGRVLFINADGAPQFTAFYNMPMMLRDSELFTEYGIFYQNHQRADGQWVYKFMRPRANRPTCDDLSDYRHPADADWDGPGVERPMASWDHVDRAIGRLISEDHGDHLTHELTELQRLAFAAFHKLPVPDILAYVEQAVPEAINLDLASADQRAE